jgi:hypothetical protein
MKALIGLAMAVLILPVACGDDDVVSDGGGGGWCEFARTIDDASNDLNFQSAPDAIEEALNGLIDLLNQARSRAPGEIRGSVIIAADAFNEFADALDNVAYDFGNLDQEALSAFETPERRAADDAIENYNDEKCGIPREGES